MKFKDDKKNLLGLFYSCGCFILNTPHKNKTVMKVKKGGADYVENIKDVEPAVTICTVNLCLYIRVKTLNCKHTKNIFSLLL